MKRLQPVAVRYLNLEVVKRKFVDAQLLPAAVAELNVVSPLQCLLNILYHVLRVWDNLVDKGSYHVFVFVHGIVSYRIAEMILSISFCYILCLVDVLFDDAAALRIVGQLLRPLNLEDTECEGRPENKYLVRPHNAVLA